MEQMFPCGMMSHEARRMWEREEGMKRERDQGGGAARKTEMEETSRRHLCIRPTGRMNARLETTIKLKSIVQRLITDLWRFLHDTKKTSTWKMYMATFQYILPTFQHLLSFFELHGHNSELHVRILNIIPSLIWSFWFFYLRQFSLSDFHISSYSVK